MSILVTIRSPSESINKAMGDLIADRVGQNRDTLWRPRTLWHRLRAALRPDKTYDRIGTQDYGVSFVYEVGDFKLKWGQYGFERVE